MASNAVEVTQPLSGGKATVLPMPQAAGYEPESEIIGRIEELHPFEWSQVIDAIEPTGPGNPAPLVSARNARLIGKPVELKLKSSGKPWALKADFIVEGRIMGVVWSDHQQAAALWKPSASFDLELELSARHFGGKIYYNWSVVKCFQVNAPSHPAPASPAHSRSAATA
jgi:hypothetical protein